MIERSPLKTAELGESELMIAMMAAVNDRVEPVVSMGSDDAVADSYGNVLILAAVMDAKEVGIPDGVDAYIDERATWRCVRRTFDLCGASTPSMECIGKKTREAKRRRLQRG